MRKILKEYWILFRKRIRDFIPLFLSLLLYLVLSNTIYKNQVLCIVKRVFGFPCIGCGMTRAFYCLLKFDLVGAFYYHPLWWLLILVGFIVFFNERPIFKKINNSSIFWISIMFIFIIVYILRMLFVFPKYPMDFYNENLLRNFIYR